MKLRAMFGLIIIAALGCDEESGMRRLDPDVDQLIFGTYAGYCSGERCVEIFAVQKGKLYEDRSDFYPASSSTFDFEQLSKNKYELVESIYRSIPNALLQSESTTFGCPDCTDGGGVFIQITAEGRTATFFIDNFKNKVPKYLHTLIDDVHEKVDLLQ